MRLLLGTLVVSTVLCPSLAILDPALPNMGIPQATAPADADSKPQVVAIARRRWHKNQTARSVQRTTAQTQTNGSKSKTTLEQPNTSDPRQLSLEDVDQIPKDDVDGKLIAFCWMAILKDHGLSNTQTVATDRWITSHLLTEKSFRETLSELPSPPQEWTADLWKDQPENTAESFSKWSEVKDRDIVSWYFRREPKIREDLFEKLGSSNRGKLLYVYLHVEGLMSLCRPEFQFVFDHPDGAKQAELRELYATAWSEDVSPCYRGLFVLRSNELDLIPAFVAETRRVTSQCDTDATMLLSESERRRLALLTSTSFPLAKVTTGPGIMRAYFEP